MILFLIFVKKLRFHKISLKKYSDSCSWYNSFLFSGLFIGTDDLLHQRMPHHVARIETADLQFDFYFTRGDGKTKNLTGAVVEDHGPGPLSPTSPLVDCYVYGVIDEACTSVAGPFKLAVVLKDAPTSVVERTIWIIEGCIADTNSATTF